MTQTLHTTSGSSKTYDHNVGLSCSFRQWKAKSHCNKLHGYSLKVRLEFEAQRLDETNWVVDFGGMKEFKQWLERMFDHKTLVTGDDPELDWYKWGEKTGTMDLVIMENVGCEAFSNVIFHKANLWLSEHGYSPRVTLKKVEVSEHSGNSGWTRLL